MLVVQTHKEMQRISHALDARFCTAVRKLCKRIYGQDKGEKVMKCDELTPVTREYADEYWADRFAMVYNADEVDAAIAELKRENERLVKCCKEYDSRQRIDERIKFNGAQQQLRVTKRALWLARAERALEKIAWFKLWNTSISTMNPEDGARQEFDKWKKNLGKFLKKAEEYK